MKQALVIMLVLLGLAARPALSEQRSCWSVSVMERLEACTALIDDPNTDDITRADAHTMRGHANSILRRFTESIADFDKAIALNPQNAMAFNNRAWANFKWHKDARGLDDVEQALQLDPGSEYAWDTRAHLMQVLGRHDEAFKDYETAVGFGGMPTVKLYQCGLKERGLYKGEVNGIYSIDTRAALKSCSFMPGCDPLPDGVDDMAIDINCEQTVS